MGSKKEKNIFIKEESNILRLIFIVRRKKKPKN